MNFRKITGLNPNYFEINREERNYTAILFAALCEPDNAIRFLKRCGISIDALAPDFGIYFEYSFLRDLWFQINDNETKKNIIRNLLFINNIDSILSKPVVEINRVFGTGGNPSSEYIESPSNWAITKYSSLFPCNEDFERICMFKWSFNIKPDIVIHIDKDTALCIEAKYESREGQYPSSQKDQMIFKERNLNYVGQTRLQKYMMQDLLGIKTKFIFLVSKKATSDSHEVINWKEAFKLLNLSKFPGFAKQMVKKISKTAV